MRRKDVTADRATVPVRRTRWLLPLLIAFLLPACHLIFRYEDRSPDGGGVTTDGTPPGKEAGSTLGDSGNKEDKSPSLLDAGGACPAPVAVKALSNTAGGYSLAYNHQTMTLAPLTVAGLSGVDVMSVDHPGEAAGFVISMPEFAADLAGLMDHAIQRISAGAIVAGGKAQLITGGVVKTSHDNHSLLAGLRLEVTTSAALKPDAVRWVLAGALLKKEKDYNSVLGNWFPFSYPYQAKRSFVIALAVLHRAGARRVIISGSVAARERVTERAAAAGLALDDMSNGTLIAGASATLQTGCSSWQLNNKRPQADIIWVMDESGSMSSKLSRVSDRASAMFKVIGYYQLDVRMGITTTTSPKNATTTVGKLCSDSSSSGGADRFLGPDEQATITACLKNPPYDNLMDEWGLANAHEAVTRHLPRTTSASDMSKIRGGAEVAVILVTDEQPQEIMSGTTWNGTKGFMSNTSAALASCSMTGAEKSSLASFIKPWTDLFGGKHQTWKAAARARMFVVARHCVLPCTGSNVPWGYQEISRATGGQQADLCQADLGLSLEGFLEDMAGAASPLKLSKTPISASLKVRYGTTWLDRSRDKGFDYRGATNSVVLVNKTHLTKDKVTATYSYWK